MDLVNAVSVASVILSLLFVARQTRDLARQTRISNSIAGAGLVHDILEVSHAWHAALADDPHLRPYFFDNRACAAGSPDRARTEIMAEMLADILDYDLVAAKLMPDAESPKEWHRWPRHMLLQSPILREVVQRHRDWWPGLSALYTQSVSGEPPGDPPPDDPVHHLPHPLLDSLNHRGRWHRRFRLQ